MSLNPMAMLRSIRIRHWTDIVLIAIAAVMLWGIQALLQKLFPNMSEKTAYIISTIITFIFVLIWVFNVPIPE